MCHNNETTTRQPEGKKTSFIPNGINNPNHANNSLNPPGNNESKSNPEDISEHKEDKTVNKTAKQKSVDAKTKQSVRTLRFQPTQTSNDRFVIIITVLYMLFLIPWILFMLHDHVKMVDSIDGNCKDENILFQSPIRTYSPTNATETTSYQTLESYHGLTTSFKWDPNWLIEEALHECVDRGDYSSLELYVSCANNSVGRLCVIDKYPLPPNTKCNRSTEYNTIYFFDDPSGSIYGGVFKEPACTVDGVNIQCGEYQKNYGELFDKFQDLVQIIRDRTICLVDLTVPKFALNKLYLTAMTWFAISICMVFILIFSLIALGWIPYDCCKFCAKYFVTEITHVKVELIEKDEPKKELKWDNIKPTYEESEKNQ